MASSSSSHIKKTYDVFSSFHGPDVRKRFLSHLRTHFASKGITTFNDQEIMRGHTIGPKLIEAIRESRVSIVVLSKKYASSSWCLDELVEIFHCKEALGQIVMTIFYEVDPSDVRKQRGDFGTAFKKTCQGKSEEVKQIWSKALADVATIAGEHSLNWDNEAKMIQKIATDVSVKLNATPSTDFEDMVGLEAHLRKLDSLLRLESDDVKVIGIWGPAGIGKSTIVEALYSQLSSSFQLSCSMGNLKGSYKSTMGVTGYDSKLYLQNLLLSKILNQKDMRVNHLGAIKERLQDQRVLIVLDDVDDLEQLEVLAKELSWFGSGSRIIVTTEDKKILKAHMIHNIYHVDFPSKKDALEIFCLSAFKQSFVPCGFEELAKKVVVFCGNLPLGLRVVGSSLRGESKHEWESQLSRIETSLDRKIEDVLRVGYDRMLKKDQSLFLHIACFFNNGGVNHVTSVLADSNLDVGNGLKTLADKSLVHTNGSIVMHYLLQQLGRHIVLEQSDEPGKRQFLVEVEEIHDVLANETGTGSVIGISLDTSKIDNDHNFSVGKRAFEGMRNLRFLRIYRNLFGGNATLQIPEDMEYLPRLRLLHWNSYPRKILPPRFKPECLVELHMSGSNLEKLWGGIQPLPNLKSIDLSRSHRLKEIPNLLNATNLETLKLEFCSSLVELPSSIGNLNELKKLDMCYCKKLRVIPTNINLASLEEVDMSFCSQLASFPDISMNIRNLNVGFTKIEEVPSSIRNLHKLKKLNMSGCKNLRVIPTNINLASLEEVNMTFCSQLASFPDISMNIRNLNVDFTDIKDVPPAVVRCWSRLELLEIGSRRLRRLTHVPLNVRKLNLSNSDIARIPDCVIGLPHLVNLMVENCPKLVSIPALSLSLEFLSANDCVSLKRVRCSFHNPVKLTFLNCLKLDEEARRGIIQQLVRDKIWLPGKEIPAEFTHKATGKSMTIRFYNCLQLYEEARRGIIQQSICDNIWIPGKEIPAVFTQKATGNSITIPLAPRGEGNFSASSRFKACFLLSPTKVDGYFNISCDLRSKGGVTINSIVIYPWQSDEFLSYPLPGSEHLVIFSGDLFPQQNRCHELDVTMSEIIFEFLCFNNDETIIECGVQIMTEEAEGSSSNEVDNFETESSRSSEVDYYFETESSRSSEVDYYESGSRSDQDEYVEAEGSSSSEVDNFETGSSSSEVDYYESGGNNHQDADGDGDEDYEAEGFKLSQDENIKTNWSWLRKLGLKRRG